MDEVKNKLIDEHCSDAQRSTVVTGYHMGRRPLIGSLYYPDIICVHNLHLHVIIEPKTMPRLFRYPAWLPLMWKSQDAVMREVQKLKVRIA